MAQAHLGDARAVARDRKRDGIPTRVVAGVRHARDLARSGGQCAEQRQRYRDQGEEPPGALNRCETFHGQPSVFRQPLQASARQPYHPPRVAQVAHRLQRARASAATRAASPRRRLWLRRPSTAKRGEDGRVIGQIHRPGPSRAPPVNPAVSVTATGRPADTWAGRAPAAAPLPQPRASPLRCCRGRSTRTSPCWRVGGDIGLPAGFVTWLTPIC